MLSEELLRSLSSIDESELEVLYKAFCEKNGTDSEDEFVSNLYKSRRINTEDLKSYRFLKKIEYTQAANKKTDNKATTTSSTDNTANSDDDFTILDSIDEGGMGEILIAKDNELGRTVAFKRIHKHVAEVPSYLDRFLMEAQVTAQLQHPNIVPVYEMKVDGNNAAYAMKLIQGSTLKDIITESQNQYNDKGKLDKHHNLSARLEHFLKVCDALHYAHRKGVIHRDLKPLNVMVGPFNEVYVMDWGIAKIISVDENMFDDQTEKVGSSKEDDSDETQIGQLLGTPAYMSPEQANGQINIIDHRSDLFSLGLILFELVTLRRAYIADDKETTLDKAKKAKLADAKPYASHQNIPKQLVAIIRKATNLDPDARYTTVEEFADDIRRYMRGDAIKARRETPVQKLLRWMNRHRLATLNAMVYLILISFTVVGWSLYQQQQTKVKSQSQSQKMSQFVSDVSKQAQKIDTKFLKYEAIVQSIAASTVTLLERAQPDPEPYYDYKDFADPALAPPDLAESSVYGFPVSVGWHAYKLAPGVEYETVENIVRSLNPLRHTFKSMMLKSHSENIAADDHEMAMSVIKDQGLPLVWTFIGLEEGIFAEYPGKTGYPEDFDPRVRPWYVNTLKNEGVCWMPPYIDVGGRGVMLPCTKKLFNKEGRFLGVAAVEMTLEHIRHRLMSMPGIEGIKNTYLLNERAEIVVDSSEVSDKYERGTLINSIENLKAYPHENVVKGVLKGDSGFNTYTENGVKKILAYYRLNSIGWYYLAEADASHILQF